MFRLQKEWQKKVGMAAAVFLTLAAGMLLFYRHWQFELPLYPNVDEQLSLGCIYELLGQHLYAGDIYVLDFFRYPHLTFYYAAVGARILGKFLAGVDTVVLLRYVICGTALLSNVCVYFSVKIMTGSRKWAYLGFLLSVFSLYGYAYLYYTGPDTLLYAVANIILLLGCLIWREKDEERAVYLWYPLLAVCIGLAMAAKYHGVVLLWDFWRPIPASGAGISGAAKRVGGAGYLFTDAARDSRSFVKVQHCPRQKYVSCSAICFFVYDLRVDRSGDVVYEAVDETRCGSRP